MAKPFLTPSSTSETTQCRTIVTPNNKEWLGVFNSALLELLNTWNWEQVNDTDLTIEEAIAIVEPILTGFFNTPDCGTGGGCLLPGLDTPPFRLGEDGHFQMLNPETNEWGTPTGEYAIPATPAREESTPYERRCAAAENAAHVLFLVYEAITDEISMGGDTLQVAAAMVAALVTALGGWIAAPVYAIVQLTIALFAGVVEILQVLGADVWTADFNQKLKCALYECATDDGDVVHFDLECIRAALTVTPDILDPDWFYDLQLFAQILFLMETITEDGLDAAGATTDITVFDCDDCGLWEACFDFTLGQQGWEIGDGWGATVAYVAGEGWKPANTATSGAIGIRLEFPETLEILSVGVVISTPMTGNLKRLFYAPDGSTATGTNSTFYSMVNATEYGITDRAGFYDWIEIATQNGSPNASYPKNYAITRIIVNGRGTNPYEDEICP